MDKEEMAFIETFLTQASIQKRWQYARAFVESYGDSIHEIRQKYLINHVMRISADEHIYLEKHSSIPAMRERLIGLGIADTWLGLEVMNAGKMNFAMNKHHLLDSKTDTRIVVIEKIFHAKNKGGFMRETKLLESQGPDKLRSPVFFGKIIEDPFYFEFAEFVAGRTPSQDEYQKKYHRRALRHLWACLPTEELLGRVKENKMLIRLPEVLELLENMDTKAVEQEVGLTVSTLKSLLEQAFEVYQAGPNTVFHDDLHRGNILAIDDDFHILDWDKWKYEKPGSGAVYTRTRKAESVESFIKGSYSKDIAISLRRFRSNFLFFNTCHFLRKNELDKAGFFAMMLKDG